MTEYFILEEASSFPEKFLIKVNIDLLNFPNGTEGSYNVLAARVMSISFANYLRFCRDELKAKIIGKNSKYPVPYFEKSEEVKAFVKLLNVRMKYIIYEQKHPYVLSFDKDNNIFEKTYYNGKKELIEINHE